MTPLFIFLALGLISLTIPVSVYASSGPITVTNPSSDNQSMLEDESTLSLNITYWNQTEVSIDEHVLNYAESDKIFQFIQAVINGEDLKDLELPEEEEIEETTEEEESDGGGSDGGSGDSSDDPLEADPSQGNPNDDNGNDTNEGGGGDFDDGGETDSVEESVEEIVQPEQSEPEPQNTTCMIAPYCGNNVIHPYST